MQTALDELKCKTLSTNTQQPILDETTYIQTCTKNVMRIVEMSVTNYVEHYGMAT